MTLEKYLHKIRGASGLVSVKHVEIMLRDCYEEAYSKAMEALKVSPHAFDQDKIDKLEIELKSLKTASKEADINYKIAKARLREIESRVELAERRLFALKQGQLELEVPIDVRQHE